MSMGIQSGITLPQLSTMDFGGFDGETKPWAILPMAAASFNLQLPEYDVYE
jgi:hypothetical protein